ncbi:G patch domain-containing protein 3 [Conger conger]|uniref:G patch domain-containing protein 3 n=1 Tax=Conger conger TaxID=82655 RepID=UPI002A5A81FC|nr:G patch domain-containing protein 3 [Conger conger]
MAESANVLYFVVSNIPAPFRSADLRNYFSQFIESGGFFCFHYRHRPEVLKDPAESARTQNPEQTREDPPAVPQETVCVEEGSSESAEIRRRVAASKDEKTCCCVVSVHAGEADRFMKMYAGNQWIDSKGNWLARRCVIRRVKVSDETGTGAFPYRTKAEQRWRGGGLSERVTAQDLRGLVEMNPPALMPQGSVGTPVGVFLRLIQACRLPPRLIRQLGLSFPQTASRRRYGNVPFLYQDTPTVRPVAEAVYTATGEEICSPAPITTATTGPEGEEICSPAPITTPTTGPEGEESESGPDDDDDRCEEWERHEALHEDVTSQERSRERLYEEEIELKWEKGGSGLVFYTDAQYWQEEEGDFDEQTADDWDVDMSVYYDKDGGDMDARDFVQMRRETRLRAGLEEGSVQQQPIGSFERFTKGVGRRLMERQGWRDGDGLGQSCTGLSEALETEGQHPKCRRGFGYHGEKLSSFLPVKKPRPHFHISTVYDLPRDTDQGDALLRRQPTSSLKYRPRPRR